MPDGSDGILHAAGVMMGKDRNTDRNTRNTLVLFFFLFDGGTREEDEVKEGCGGSGGGCGGAEDFGGDCSSGRAAVDFGSPINPR